MVDTQKILRWIFINSFISSFSSSSFELERNKMLLKMETTSKPPEQAGRKESPRSTILSSSISGSYNSHNKAQLRKPTPSFTCLFGLIHYCRSVSHSLPSKLILFPKYPAPLPVPVFFTLLPQPKCLYFLSQPVFQNLPSAPPQQVDTSLWNFYYRSGLFGFSHVTLGSCHSVSDHSLYAFHRWPVDSVSGQVERREAALGKGKLLEFLSCYFIRTALLYLFLYGELPS